MELATSKEQRSELEQQRRKVDFDTYDITVSELLRRLGAGRFEIAPTYQRQFRWSPERQSRLVESVLLGIPVPPLFMATNRSADKSDKWEVVDGLQRLLSLANFAGDKGSTRRSSAQRRWSCGVSTSYTPLTGIALSTCQQTSRPLSKIGQFASWY